MAREKVGCIADINSGGASLTPEAELLQALLIANEIDSNAGEPGAYGAVATEARATVIGLQEAVLGDGFGEVRISDGEGDETEQARPVCPDKGIDVVQLRSGSFGGLNIRDGYIKS